MKKRLLLTLLSISIFPTTPIANKLEGARQTQQPAQAVLVDANGTMIGEAQTNVSADVARVYFGFNEKHYYAQLEDEWFYGFNLYYDGRDCTGNAYVRKPLVERSIEPLEALRDGVFYTGGRDESDTATVVSVWEELNGKADCDNFTTSPPIDVYPAIPLVDTNVYKKPYQLKLIIAQ